MRARLALARWLRPLFVDSRVCCADSQLARTLETTPLGACGWLLASAPVELRRSLAAVAPRRLPYVPETTNRVLATTSGNVIDGWGPFRYVRSAI
jgi:hypothetical protein